MTSFRNRDELVSLMNGRAPNALRAAAAQEWSDILAAPFNLNPDIAADEAMRINDAYGIGFTGHVPPGGRLAVARGDARAQLINWANTIVSGVSGRPWALYNILANTTPWLSDSMRPPPGVSILSPGDIIRWSEPSQVSAWPLNPYLYHSGFIGIAEDSLSTFRGYIRMPRAVARTFYRPDVVTQRLEYTRVPWVIEGAFGNAPTNVDDGYPCFGSHLTIAWKANATDLTRISTSESFDIWWLLADGIWHHHEDDDFDAAGRGVVSATHDVEVYEIPQGAMRVAIDDTSTAGTETPMLIFEERR